ncbi:MAG: AAA domain-containing protein [Verrucomicrobiales bacterium]|nr:AAA domain-containing protein [Verrucomicrobiales bacterium]
MNSASGILQYLAECYRENGSRAGVVSLKSNRVRQSLILEGVDPVVSSAVLDGLYFVPGKKAAALATQARLYEKERELFCGSIFFIGALEEGSGRTRPGYAPLILYPTAVSEITETGGAEFVIDTSRGILNYALLERLGDDDFVLQMEKAVETSGHSEGCIGELRRLFSKQFPETETDGLFNYPNLLPSRDLRHYFTQLKKEDGESWSLQSAATLFLVDKSTEMRGVINDLQTMAKSKELSTAAASLLGHQAPGLNVPAPVGYTPALLSPAQKNVAESARSRSVTLAVGPPGTGKSFTIAALAMQAVSRGESVLVVSKMDHAVDVVADKIEEALNLAGVCVRAGRKNYLKELKSYLENLLSGFHGSEPPDANLPRQAESKLKYGRKQLLRAEQRLHTNARRAQKRGKVLTRTSHGFFTRWRQRRILSAAGKRPLLSGLVDEVCRNLARQVEDTVVLLREKRRFYLNTALRRDRKTFRNFSKSTRARTSKKREEYLLQVRWKTLFQTLPVWLMNLSDLHRIIPLEVEMFDLVIIDEASQCDIASVFPALQRAKRAVVTGDPKQLRHLSFLPVSRQAEFAKQFGLSEEDATRFNFRRVSLVDLASEMISDQDAVVFLNEHFRSRPEIIGFSNREFYGGNLAIMTGHREIDHQTRDGLQVFPCHGKRGENGVNEEEIDAIFEQINHFSEAGKELLTLGILSPFRAQVDAIMKRLESRPDIHRLLEVHRILVGTSHSFQGEERDIMFLSFTLDDESPAASFRFLDKEDIFNVAITRARIENRIFASFSSAGKSSRLACRFLAYAASGTEMRGNRVSLSTQACFAGIREAIEGLGATVEEGFHLGGYPIDLLCRKGRNSLAIDLVGFRGEAGKAMSLDRHLLLRRAGIELFPVALDEWMVRRDEVLKEIEKRISLTELKSP